MQDDFSFLPETYHKNIYYRSNFVFVLKAQQELETEGLKGEFDRTQATQTLETTLDKLLDHLEEKDAPEQQAVQRGSEAATGGGGGSTRAPKQPGNSQSGRSAACPFRVIFPRRPRQ